MKISVKTLKGTHFQIEVKPEDKVSFVFFPFQFTSGNEFAYMTLGLLLFLLNFRADYFSVFLGISFCSSRFYSRGFNRSIKSVALLYIVFNVFIFVNNWVYGLLVCFAMPIFRFLYFSLLDSFDLRIVVVFLV